jgi:cyclic-di-AMP phosphodiesterase PgpH
MLSASEKHSRTFSSRSLVKAILLIAVSILALAALALPIAIRPSAFPLKVQDVASQDIEAPRPISFTSEVLTEQARKEAESSILPVYQPADPGIARHQIEKLRVSLDYINTVRQDSFANLDQKLGDLAEIAYFRIEDGLSKKVLALNESRWQVVEQESRNVLEEIMRKSIRDDQLADVQRSIPTLISYSLPEEQATLVSGLVNPFVIPNSLFSEQQTQLARDNARKSVTPIVRSFVTGETIVRRGQVITPATWEVLGEYNLVQPARDVQDLIAVVALVALVTVFIWLYVIRRNVQSLNSIRNLIVIGLTFIFFLFCARLVIPNRAIIPYIFPLAAFGLTVSTLFSLELGLVFSLVLSILTAYGLSNSLDLTLFYTLSTLCGVLVLGRGRRVATFFWAGLSIGAAGSAVIIAYRLPNTLTDWIGITTLIGAAFFNGLASASLTLLLQFLFSQMLSVTTALQLLDLLRPDHPLLQFMLRSAPGSYQHSLQVANLAEQAAEKIGADALLIRVGAIYHDCGKASNPSFFIENQVASKINPHDDLDPVTSAATIIMHVEDGLQLAKRYRLPQAVQDFIREHHGTLLTRYQYAKALELAGCDPTLINLDHFRYPGPKPRSRETALLMLADGVEARARAELPKNEEELRTLIKKVFDFLQNEEQFENTRITFRDLTLARNSFLNTLLNTYHPRIQYPEIRTIPVPNSVEIPDESGRSTDSAPTLPISMKQKTP